MSSRRYPLALQNALRLIRRTTKNLSPLGENSLYLPNVGALALVIRSATNANEALCMGMKLTEWGLGFSEFWPLSARDADVGQSVKSAGSI